MALCSLYKTWNIIRSDITGCLIQIMFVLLNCQCRQIVEIIMEHRVRVDKYVQRAHTHTHIAISLMYTYRFQSVTHSLHTHIARFMWYLFDVSHRPLHSTVWEGKKALVHVCWLLVTNFRALFFAVVQQVVNIYREFQMTHVLIGFLLVVSLSHGARYFFFNISVSLVSFLPISFSYSLRNQQRCKEISYAWHGSNK